MSTTHTTVKPDRSSTWHPNSWRTKPTAQPIRYDDPEELARVVTQLGRLPPLVADSEIITLRNEIAEAQTGRRFVLQAGDCAEVFADCTPSVITKRLRLLLQMQRLLAHGLKRPVVCIGRFAGQYAKPRTDPFETLDGLTLPTFRGELINGPEFSARARRHDPTRLLEGYARAAFTVNLVRSLIDSGSSTYNLPETWGLEWVSRGPECYRRIISEIGESLLFMSTLADKPTVPPRCYISHEALHLHYEEAQTHAVADGKWLNLSTHFPWIGMRTVDPAGAHMEYMRGIGNPVGVKVGPATTPEGLLETIDMLNPSNAEGKICLITRLGADHATAKLKLLIDAVQGEGRIVLWMVDPMHGNTEMTATGYKTRHFERICAEIDCTIKAHRAAGTYLGGLHLEISADNVTECLGGTVAIELNDLPLHYTTTVDPRLNPAQSLEIVLFTLSKFRHAQYVSPD